MNQADAKKSRKPLRKGSKQGLSPVMHYKNPGQLTVPTHLLIGTGSKLYLAYGNGTPDLSANPRLISVRESVAWFRLAHENDVNVRREAAFSEWLRLVERELTVTNMLRSMNR